MTNLEQMKSIALSELAERGFRDVEFVNSEYFNGQPEQPFLMPELPHFVLRFRNCECTPKSTIEDGDSLLCVKIDEMTMKGSFVSTF